MLLRHPPRPHSPTSEEPFEPERRDFGRAGRHREERPVRRHVFTGLNPQFPEVTLDLSKFEL
jgi:hypothetical protein